MRCPRWGRLVSVKWDTPSGSMAGSGDSNFIAGFIENGTRAKSLIDETHDTETNSGEKRSAGECQENLKAELSLAKKGKCGGADKQENTHPDQRSVAWSQDEFHRRDLNDSVDVHVRR
jgi:hypothetical protein